MIKVHFCDSIYKLRLLKSDNMERTSILLFYSSVVCVKVNKQSSIKKIQVKIPGIEITLLPTAAYIHTLEISGNIRFSCTFDHPCDRTT